MKPIPSRRLWPILLLGLVLAGGAIVAFRSEPSFVPIRSSVQLLPGDSKIPGQPVSLFARWIPISWAWLWRLHDSIRGPLEAILIDVKIIDCTDVSEDALASLLLRAPLAETNGLRGWIVQDAALTELGRKLERMGGRGISHPRVQTAHAIHSSLSVGNTVPVSGASVQVVLVLELLPLIQPDGTDLTSVLTVTEPIRKRTSGTSEVQTTAEPAGMANVSIVTNLTAAARWNLPNGTGFFMLGSAASNDSRRIGVIVSATVQRPKK